MLLRSSQWLSIITSCKWHLLFCLSLFPPMFPSFITLLTHLCPWNGTANSSSFGPQVPFSVVPDCHAAAGGSLGWCGCDISLWHRLCCQLVGTGVHWFYHQMATHFWLPTSAQAWKTCSLKISSEIDGFFFDTASSDNFNSQIVSRCWGPFNNSNNKKSPRSSY